MIDITAAVITVVLVVVLTVRERSRAKRPGGRGEVVPIPRAHPERLPTRCSGRGNEAPEQVQDAAE
jgi:hypothetical protein